MTTPIHPSASPPSKSQDLDEVMLAMDVVDTLRRSAHLAEKELSADTRDEAFMDRLREMYAAQGIEVPDHILREGIEALREDRFTYTPTPPSFSRQLAKLYITRDQWGRRALMVFAALIITLGAYSVLVALPAHYERQQIEQQMTDIIPVDLETIPARIMALTEDADIEARTFALKQDGQAALANENAEKAIEAHARLQDLESRLAQSYDLRIVSGVGRDSGVWRIPDDNPNARNYYLIVEPVRADGTILSVPVTSEENNTAKTVNNFGVRVPKSVFERIKADKADDGIIQSRIIGNKPRGALDPTYTVPVSGGVITEW